MLQYTKLFHILLDRDIKIQDLRAITRLSPPTMAKLRKGKTVSTEVILRICEALQVQPGDIMEYIPDKGGEK
jgi:DNA-binding Xre family transcriptional regulator